jgi:LEA14-like dessication related protein
MWNRVLAATLVVALLGGCSLARLEPPRLQVVEVGLLSGDLLKQQLRVKLRVHNPNSVELPVRGITYEVQLSGETFANGESSRDFLVPALGSTEFDLDVTANAAAAVLRMIGDRNRGDPTYRVLGKVRLAKGVIKTIPFDHTGTLKLR